RPDRSRKRKRLRRGRPPPCTTSIVRRALANPTLVTLVCISVGFGALAPVLAEVQADFGGWAGLGALLVTGLSVGRLALGLRGGVRPPRGLWTGVRRWPPPSRGRSRPSAAGGPASRSARAWDCGVRLWRRPPPGRHPGRESGRAGDLRSAGNRAWWCCWFCCP